MKITSLKDLDLSKYKLAYFQGNSLSSSDKCQDDVMKMVDAGCFVDSYDFNLNIALIPKNSRLQDCGGDDWNDNPAECNASGFYEFPKGTIFLSGKLGEELKMEEKNESGY